MDTGPAWADAARSRIARGARRFRPATTTFDGQRYTVAFTPANPGSVLAEGRTYATERGYAFATQSDGMIAFTITGPRGGTALGYFDGGGQANTGVRIVVAASDLTADGTAIN